MPKIRKSERKEKEQELENEEELKESSNQDTEDDDNEEETKEQPKKRNVKVELDDEDDGEEETKTSSKKQDNRGRRKGSKNKTTDVAKKSPLIESMYEDKNKGMENLSISDLAIPFITIIQSSSPQVKSKKDQYIEEAEPGLIFNSVTNDLYDYIEGIPIKYEKTFVLWKDIDSGGGFKGQFTPESAMVQEAIQDSKGVLRPRNKKDCALIETAVFYFLLIDEDQDLPVKTVIPFKSTQLKKARKWNALATELKLEFGGKVFTPPLYSHIYTLSTKYEDNEKGDWYGWDIKVKEPIDDEELYKFAKGCYDSLSEFKEKVNFEQDSEPMPHKDNPEQNLDDEDDETVY